jgi:hypothetical protein
MKDLTVNLVMISAKSPEDGDINGAVQHPILGLSGASRAMASGHCLSKSDLWSPVDCLVSAFRQDSAQTITFRFVIGKNGR